MIKTRTNKAYTLEVLTSAYMANIGTKDEHINAEYLCDTLSLEMVNDRDIYTEVRENTRRSIESICWGAFINHATMRVKWNYGDQFVATSEHLKSFINNDYSILEPLYEEMRKERLERQEELKEAKQKEKKVGSLTKKQAEQLYKESWENWNDFKKLDKVARTLDWGIFVDTLCKEGKITQWQYNNWLSPSFCN